MNLRDLEYFYYLCKSGSFTKTAEMLYVSQPSITMALHRIEKELGAKLVLRDHSQKQLSLTEAGKAFEKRVENILNEMKEAKADISKISGGKIKLGVPPIIGAYYFPSVMRELVEKGFAEYIELVETGSVTMKNLLLSGEVDIALMGSLSPIKDNNLEAAILATDEFMVCMSKNHSLYPKENIDFKELSSEKFIVLGDSYVHNKVLKILCEQNGITIKDYYHTDEIQTAKSLIASGLGIGIMINMAVQNMNSIKTLPLTKPISFYISLALKKGHYMTLREEKIKEIILSRK